MTKYLYLHGFASSPQSKKAREISDRFTKLQIPLSIPDLNDGNFTQLTITRQLNQVKGEFPEPPQPVILIGSSLGGLTAAHLAEQNLQVQKLILLAPAFGFVSHWLKNLGLEAVKTWQREEYLSVYHYGEGRSLPLSYNFLVDAHQYSETLLQRPIPTLILHGNHDEVIPITASQEFAQIRPWVELIALDSDHALGNVIEEIWQAIYSFCQFSSREQGTGESQKLKE
ncbi:MAG TPA: YqiA/YcfP family alpha/beta fold hydrolase [Nostocaceae cyanobacterium]|nr:YqiA/YcfP family alpha/beta fold hydrolase [Nostocaceae cyanobacterium]